MDRRQFLAGAASLGIFGIWAARSVAATSRIGWREDRALYPQGVASGDPDGHNAVLWTRRPFDAGERHTLNVEVAQDVNFRRVVVTVPVLAAADWTCRALVGGLSPATPYWYRFSDKTGAGSRIGRTITAPRISDPRLVRFAFVSCNSVNEGAQNAYRRMMWEDEKAAANAKLGFMLHLGNFIYEVFEYPDEVSHRYSRTVYDLGRIPDARKVGIFPRADEPGRVPHVYRARISTTPTFRMRVRVSRSWASATITNSHGRAGRASSNIRAARPSPRSRCASRRTKRGGNIFRRASAKHRGRGSTRSCRRRSWSRRCQARRSRLRGRGQQPCRGQ